MLSTTTTRSILGAALTIATISGPAHARASAPPVTATNTVVMGPGSAALQLAPASDGYRNWRDQQRKLRVQVGVSAGLAAALLLSGVLALTVPTCNPPPGATGDYCGMPIGRFMVSGALLSAAVVTTVPAIVFGVRLGRHNRARPVALHVAPGGLALRF